MAGRARTAARGQGRPCRADGTGHEKGGCCGARRCRRVPEPRGEPTWSPLRRGQAKPGVGHAGGAQDSAQPARARLPRGSWCRAVLLGKSLAQHVLAQRRPCRHWGRCRASAGSTQHAVLSPRVALGGGGGGGALGGSPHSARVSLVLGSPDPGTALQAWPPQR